MDKNIMEINEYLEQAYTGARALDDVECMCRIARAIAALNANVNDDVFTQEFQNSQANIMTEEEFSRYMNPPED